MISLNLRRIFSIFLTLPQTCWRWWIGIFRGRPWYVKILSGLGTFLAGVVLFFVAVHINLFGLFGRSPSTDAIMNPKPQVASEIYTADGVLLGKFFRENRTQIAYEDVAPMFYKALISTEDERFYSHSGVDFAGLGGALKDMFRGNARGASTISQQLVKNMCRTRSKEYSGGLLCRVPGLGMLILKAKEWMGAYSIESNYTKKDILTMYVNTVDFGCNAFGIRTAAKTYYNKLPSELTIDECAVLVGMLKATSTYNPYLHPEACLERRNVVLDNLASHGHITREACDSLKAKPIALDFTVEKVYEGQALHFRRELAEQLPQLFAELDMDVDIYGDGLKIYTTLDSRMQAYAESVVHDRMRLLHSTSGEPWKTVPHFIENIAASLPVYKKLQAKYGEDSDSVSFYMNQPRDIELFSHDGIIVKHISAMDSIRHMVRYLHTGFLAMEPDTRYIRAWVGDIDFNYWQYDKVTACRQPGSTFKLFVYTAAMNSGFTPCTRRRDVPPNIPSGGGKVWNPKNAGGGCSYDSMTMARAFARSINTVAVRVGMEVGVDRVIQTAHAMGVETDIRPYPSSLLGASELPLRDMVQGYCTVVADGMMRRPQYVIKIVDRYGAVIYDAERDAPRMRQAIPYRSAYFMQELLKGGLSGTSYHLRNWVGNLTSTTDFGGKTGTSNSHTDSWFLGVTPRLVAGAWVGGEYSAIRSAGAGGTVALPLVGDFFKRVLNDPKFVRYQCKFPEAKMDFPEECFDCSKGYFLELLDSLDENLNDGLEPMDTVH